jgi:membrane-associated phospholipid phosphatase
MILSRDKKYVVLSGILLVFFMITFSIFAEELVAHKLKRFDIAVTRWIQMKIDPLNTRIMELLTFFGSPLVVTVLVVVSSVLLYRRGKSRSAAAMSIANGAGAGFNEILKLIFRRKRPDIHRLITARGYSFPSGHSMGSVVFYGMISYFVSRFTNSKFLKAFTYIASSLVVLMTGISRIYLGVHYPSDVIAGFLAGCTWLIACFSGLHFVMERRR